MNFRGTLNKLDETKTVLVETHCLKSLDPQYLSHDCFTIILLESGSVTARILNTDCRFTAPCVICLDEIKKITMVSNDSCNVKLIKFDPRFLNVNMQLSTIRSRDYDNLCQQHAFFQLSHFLTNDVDKICSKLNPDLFDKILSSFTNLTKNLVEQKDWYWPCRARSYFIDIINLLERIFHNFYIEEPYDVYINVALSNEFQMLLAYINDHLDRKQTLDSLYTRFRINKNQIENLFKEFLNTTFYEYLRNRRYEEAKYYLRFTELDGEQIAARIGLSSSQNFCKFFKAMSGKTPNNYRKEMVSKRKNDMQLRRLVKSQSI